MRKDYFSSDFIKKRKRKEVPVEVCVAKTTDNSPNSVPTYVIVIIVVAVVVVVGIVVVIAVLLTKRKRTYSTSSSTSSVGFEAELDSKTGAEVTF